MIVGFRRWRIGNIKHTANRAQKRPQTALHVLVQTKKRILLTGGKAFERFRSAGILCAGDKGDARLLQGTEMDGFGALHSWTPFCIQQYARVQVHAGLRKASPKVELGIKAPAQR